MACNRNGVYVGDRLFKAKYKRFARLCGIVFIFRLSGIRAYPGKLRLAPFSNADSGLTFANMNRIEIQSFNTSKAMRSI